MEVAKLHLIIHAIGDSAAWPVIDSLRIPLVREIMGASNMSENMLSVAAGAREPPCLYPELVEAMVEKSAPLWMQSAQSALAPRLLRAINLAEQAMRRNAQGDKWITLMHKASQKPRVRLHVALYESSERAADRASRVVFGPRNSEFTSYNDDLRNQLKFMQQQWMFMEENEHNFFTDIDDIARSDAYRRVAQERGAETLVAKFSELVVESRKGTLIKDLDKNFSERAYNEQGYLTAMIEFFEQDFDTYDVQFIDAKNHLRDIIKKNKEKLTNTIGLQTSNNSNAFIQGREKFTEEVTQGSDIYTILFNTDRSKMSKWFGTNENAWKQSVYDMLVSLENKSDKDLESLIKEFNEKTKLVRQSVNSKLIDILNLPILDSQQYAVSARHDTYPRL